VLNGTTTVAAVAGAANFSGLSIDKSGSGYAIQTSSTGLPSVACEAFDVTADRLVATTQPSATVGVGAGFGLTVAAEDASGNVDTAFHGNVSVSLIDLRSTGATLGGELVATAVDGVATFGGLTLDRAGDYALSIAGSGLGGTTTDRFTTQTAVGPAAKLVFLQQPVGALVKSAMNPVVTVAIEDASGNILTLDNSDRVTVAIAANPKHGIIGGTATVTVTHGVATFSDLSINKIGSGYTLRATSGALSQAASTSFNITNAARKLVFLQQPTNVMAGSTFGTAVRVAIEDSAGNILTADSSDQVTLVMAGKAAGVAIHGTTTVTVVAGVATFNNLSLTKAGSAYTIRASSGSLTQATSKSFQVTPAAASQLVFLQQPANAVTGASFSPAVKVAVEDSFGNVLTSDKTDQVTLAIGTNPAGGTLGGTTTVTVKSGVATFGKLSIDKPGSGYTLIASSGTRTGATSTSFDVGSATKEERRSKGVSNDRSVDLAVLDQVLASLDDYRR
jgi:hypothetical protein